MSAINSQPHAFSCGLKNMVKVQTPFDQQYLTTEDGHEVFFEQYGNPIGLPILGIHGGPGVGNLPGQHTLFDLEKFRVILVDQRGCGRSKPLGKVDHNNTSLLIHDFERIRSQLSIDKWCLFGGSWGTTLALTYAQTHPESISHMVLRGVFLARQQDFDWLYQYGTCEIFPEHWDSLLKPIGHKSQSVIEDYHRLIHESSNTVAEDAMKKWATWEASVARLAFDASLVDTLTQPDICRAFSLISTHYFKHKCFLEPNQILNRIHRIKDIPTWIVHGRYDMLCPVSQAYLLHQHLNNAKLNIAEHDGHAQCENGIHQLLLDCLVEIR